MAQGLLKKSKPTTATAKRYVLSRLPALWLSLDWHTLYTRQKHLIEVGFTMESNMLIEAQMHERNPALDKSPRRKRR